MSDHSMTWVIGNAVKGTIVLMGAYGLSVLLGRSSAAMRHLVWAAALAALLALPVASLVAPAWDVARPVVVSSIAPAAPAAPMSGIPEQTPLPPPSWAAFPWQSWILAAAAAGTAILLARLAVAMFKLRRLAASAAPFQLMSGIPVLLSGEISIPLAGGVLRPFILLPAEARQWSAERLRLVVLHELAHVNRRDCLIQILAQCACAFYWWQPLAWLAAARLALEREKACDDAVSLQADPAVYAGHLLELARGLPPMTAPGSAVAMAQPAALEQRVKSLLNARRDCRPLSRRVVVSGALAAALIILPLAGFRAAAQTSTGSLGGSILDASGAAVPGTRITLTNPQKGSRDITTSDAAGRYAFSRLPAGRYQIEAAQPGFARLTRGDVLVEPGAALRLDLTLEIGQISETLEIVGQTRRPPATPAPVPQRVRVGGKVQATKLLRQVKPEYPASAQQQGIEGSIVMRAVIGVDGGLLGLSVINTAADPVLAKAAADAVSQWRYQPTLLNGMPVEVVTTITVNFRLPE